MQLKDLFNIKNINSFFEGNIKYFYYKIFNKPQHIQEQIQMRLSKCQNDCLIDNKCIKCGCPVNKKVFVEKSCNEERFPDLMNNEEWEQYKKR